MKKSLFKKLMLALTAFTGVFVIASCQSTGHDANVPLEYCSVGVYEKYNETTKKNDKVATVTLAINNPTIYNTSEITFHYDALDASGQILGGETVVLPVGIRHGVAGAFSYVYTAKEGEADLVKTVHITDATITGYQTLWQTYQVPFIVAIIIAGLSVLFFGVELFAKNLSKETLKAMFREHITSELTVLLLMLIICFIPLMFSSWVTTVILLGAFLSSLLLTGLLTLLRIQFAK